jgi:hypothetical protein
MNSVNFESVVLNTAPVVLDNMLSIANGRDDSDGARGFVSRNGGAASDPPRVVDYMSVGKDSDVVTRRE